MKNKLIAALLAFIAGGFGLHKFYLGKTGQGIVYLIFFWTIIPAIIAFFESISLLIMDDEEFDLKYNPDYYNYSYEEGGEALELKSLDRLERLASLLEKGIINRDEFNQEKAYILRH